VGRARFAETVRERGCDALVLTDHRPRNATSCELAKHGSGLDVLACPCSHRMTYVATLFDSNGLARLLRAKGLPHRIEPIRPARGPP
jgi:hypothetical protein